MDTLDTSVYEKLLNAGAKMDHHESDLYVEDNATNVAILKAHGSSFTRFESAIDGTFWLDVPFAYQPFWDAKTR